MSLAVDVVKRNRKGHSTEPYSRDKLKDSIVFACVSTRSPEKQADSTAEIVCFAVESWLTNTGKQEVTSRDIRTRAIQHLNEHDPEAAYIYEHYKYTL
jgi:transcriptional regulator NrdR family protein